MNAESLPEIVQKFAQAHPGVWEAYNHLGEQAAQAGPLKEKTERLVKLALAAGGRLEGAVRSQVRRAAAAGLTRAELEHVAILAITTVGWPSAIAALSWIDDELRRG
jgi:alkylhydroperoxidase/carboxymuconolactone decarboxylase family protein YurZ